MRKYILIWMFILSVCLVIATDYYPSTIIMTQNGTGNITDTTCDGQTCNIANTGTLDGYEGAVLALNTNCSVDLTCDPVTYDSELSYIGNCSGADCNIGCGNITGATSDLCTITATTDTNETTRFNTLVGNCTKGYNMFGVKEDGERVCSIDDDTFYIKNNTDVNLHKINGTHATFQNGSVTNNWTIGDTLFVNKYDQPTSHLFKIAGNTEIAFFANNWIFNNGVFDCTVDWSTEGTLQWTCPTLINLNTPLITARNITVSDTIKTYDLNVTNNAVIQNNLTAVNNNFTFYHNGTCPIMEVNGIKMFFGC